VVDREMQAWRDLQVYKAPDVPPDILATIFEPAERRFPDDFSTSKYLIEKKAPAWRSLHR